MIVALLLTVLGALMRAVHSFAPQEGLGSAPAGTALACGYLLLSAFLAGDLFKRLRLPRLTGYLVLGILVGPGGLRLLPEPVVDNLRIFTGVAIALIALTAGSELHLRSLKVLARSIAWITLLAVVGTSLLLGLAVFAARGWLPFLAELSRPQALAIALVLGTTLVAQSPAVVVALRDEMAADGVVTRTVLAVVVLADLVVILLFAVVSSIAKAAFGTSPDVLHTARTLGWELLGSGVVGVFVGALLALYLRRVGSGSALFVVTVCFVVAEVGQRLHLDPLLLALSAGMMIRNATTMGERLHHEIEAAAAPVYVAFFGVAGATIHIESLLVVGIPAAALVLIRTIGFLTGTRAAARISGAPEAVRKFAGFGLLPQAGLALALAIVFARTFPDLGADASALVFSVVALNELAAPVLFRFALLRSGETGRRLSRSTLPPPVQ